MIYLCSKLTTFESLEALIDIFKLLSKLYLFASILKPTTLVPFTKSKRYLELKTDPNHEIEFSIRFIASKS